MDHITNRVCFWADGRFLKQLNNYTLEDVVIVFKM